MKYVTCKCDMCGKTYTPRTEDNHISDWEIISTDRSGEVLMAGFDLCSSCQSKFVKTVSKILLSKTHNKENNDDQN